MVEPVIKFNCFSYRKTALFQDVFVSLMGKYFLLINSNYLGFINKIDAQ